MRKSLLLLFLAASAWADPAPQPTPRQREVAFAFYKAVFLVAEEKAGETLAKASAFARGEMHPAVIARIPALLPAIKDLGPEEVRGILESRQGDRHQASYGTLTCLFVDARSWVKTGSARKVAWVQAPLTEAQKEALWRAAGQGKRREALIALYASAFGKDVRTSTGACRGCDGHPHAPDLRLGQVISSKVAKPEAAPHDNTCRSCRGVGVVVSVSYR